MKNALFIALGIFTVSYLAIWLSAIVRGDGHRRQKPGPLDAGIGFFTNSFIPSIIIFNASGA